MFKKIILCILVLIPVNLYGTVIYLEGDGYLNSIYPGMSNSISLVADSIDFEIGGFRFVIAEDIHYSVLNVRPGDLVESCNWEYFTWRRIQTADISTQVWPATALIEITGFASITGSHEPTCYYYDSTVTLVTLDILGSDQRYSGGCVSEWATIPFYWRDCSDNILYSQYRDTAFIVASHTISSYIFGYNNYITSHTFPGYGVQPEICDTSSDFIYIPLLDSYNNRFEGVPCGIDGCMGDLNLNYIYLEVPDLILFENYFKYGLSVFTINPEAQINNTDINLDGLRLSVADFYYGLNWKTGKYVSNYKSIVLPENTIGELSKSDQTNNLEFYSNNDIGAAYIKLTTDDGTILTKEDFDYLPESTQLGYIGDTTTILFANMNADPVFLSGENSIFEGCNTGFTITHIEAVDIAGRNVITTDNSQLPQTFELYQNYPNPFNPTTLIQASLPHIADWEYDIININGQIIRSFSGRNQGTIDIIWDSKDNHGNAVSSGIYFYRFKSEGFSSSRKMMLIK